MNLSLSTNDISYSAQDKVKEILSPLLKQANIHYFNYSVTYPDHSSFTLHTNATFYESWFTNEFPSWECYLNSGWYMWEAIDSKGKNDFARSLGIGNGIIHINRLADKTEVIAFASSPDNTNIVNFYLNNLNLLKRFKFHFIEKAANLIKIANTERVILLPKMVRDANFTIENKVSAGNHQFSKPEFDFYPFCALSERELQCYALLIRGFRLAAMSEILNIAIPTVNNYISRIKEKLGCRKKEEMIHMAEKADLMQYFMDMSKNLLGTH